MAKLEKLINSIEKEFQTKIFGDYEKDTDIKYIRFLTNDSQEFSSSSSEVLYLTDYETTKYKNLTGNILYVNCPLDTLSSALWTKEKDLFGIYNVIEMILERFQGEEEKKKNLFTLLHSKDKLKAILDEAYNTLKTPITVVNSGYTVIGKAPTDDIDENDIPRRKYPLENSFIERMREEGIEDRLIQSEYPFELFLPIMGGNCGFCGIRIKKMVVAYLFIPCVNHSLTKSELEYIFVLSQAISIQLQKDFSYQNPKVIQFNSFFKDLLSDRISSTEQLPLRALGVNFKVHKQFFFICWSFKDKETTPLSLNFQQFEISQILENSISNIHNNSFISFISADDYDTYKALHHYRIVSFLNMNNMIASISFPFTDLTKASIYYKQAIYQLEHHLFSQSPCDLFSYIDFYLTHLVDIAEPRQQIEACIHYKIREMILYDNKNRTNYTNTLVEFIKCNRNAQDTANALFIHKSTLFYRFSKMNELFQIDLNDSGEFFSYEFSLRILHLV